MYKNIHTLLKSDNASLFADSLLNSYSQIFFSTYKPFAVLIMLVTFIDFYTGLTGLLAVMVTSVGGFLLNLDKNNIAKGLYGFNGLLVGLGLGIYYSFSWYLIFIVVMAAILTLFISVSMQGIIGKYNIPYLSIPFLLGIWIFTIATKHFDALGISERGIYTMNELYVIGGHSLVKVYEYFNAAEIPPFLKVYFISLSAILFQYNVLAGLILSIGLLLFSRIAFSLSLIGFFIAYSFYRSINADITLIEYSYIGFNYILTAIAIGGFFLIPSPRSYVSVGILVPLVAILSISLSSVLLVFNLPIYSLPFNVMVLMFLYVLKYRMSYSSKLAEVYYQYNSPEANLYTYVNNQQRYQFLNYTPVKLPFMGTWKVSQGHDGEYTHQKKYRHAWDFVITDNEDKQFKNDGDFLEDYYCYNKPVIACDKGVVEEVVDYIDDNVVGEVNLEHNWGNTVVIKHNDSVYSKVSHLKKDSITVKKGDSVGFGQVIGKCGNSGRSPYPHIHFQLQPFPYIGSETLDHPISNFLIYNNGSISFNNYTVPKQGELISNIETNELIKQAFHFVPGQQIKFNVEGNKVLELVWNVKLTPANETYLECTLSKSKAYFVSTDNLFYFTHFDGKKESLLHHFYLGAFKIQKSFYTHHQVNDDIPLHQYFPKKYLWFLDFISPFIRLAKSRFSLNYISVDDVFSPSRIELQSTTMNTFIGKKINDNQYIIQINQHGLESFNIKKTNKHISLKRILNNEVSLAAYP
ncbi:urea transporter [Saccharicrinis sp. GN24d3]|uniref:urea transporter n=1 Tax=Saccharicrinis sp. GN24d3 TaxID=3458416 RepID=UPI004036E8AE